MAATPTASHAGAGIDPPKKGEKFRCSACGMEIQVNSDCGCKDKNHVHFQCCGKQMDKV